LGTQEVTSAMQILITSTK